MINTVPLQTTANLLAAFPKHPPLIQPSTHLPIPIGIEIEVSWRSYFPDLWVEGFPNVDAETLACITEECARREKVLLPKLVKATECGVKSGADKYWEFAFDPVTDVSILANQVRILQVNGLIPKGNHSLHITFGGLKLTRNAHYIAMILEGMACDEKRVRSGFHPTDPNLSVGWARKGFAGTFEKSGDNDLMHGYDVGTEIRLLHMLEDPVSFYLFLNLAHQIGQMALDEQRGYVHTEWKNAISECKAILAEHRLPDTNWKKPHQNPDIWRRFVQELPVIQEKILTRIIFKLV